MKPGWRLSWHVCAVSAAIAYIYFTTVLVFIDQWFGIWSSPGMLNAVVYTALAVMCVVSYRLAVCSDPGRVPSTYMPDVEDADHPIHEIKRKGGDLRYCQKCSLYKPPRAHHCRICNRCVLRMVYAKSNVASSLHFLSFLNNVDELRLASLCKDHHCVWMNNCVGHSNYKIFFVFVVYAVTESIYSMIISGILLIPLCLALSFFLGWHIYLIVQNKTTIEYHEGVRAMWLAEKGGQLYSHPYDIGLYENLTEILGPNAFSWFCPTTQHIGSGLRFRTKYDKAIEGSTT